MSTTPDQQTLFDVVHSCMSLAATAELRANPPANDGVVQTVQQSYEFDHKKYVVKLTITPLRVYQENIFKNWVSYPEHHTVTLPKS
jgi:hypothetical protein